MAWRAQLSKRFQEVWITVSQVSAESKGLRDFINKNHSQLQLLNPGLKIHVREAHHAQPRIIACYEWGLHLDADVPNADEKTIYTKLERLYKMGGILNPTATGNAVLPHPINEAGKLPSALDVTACAQDINGLRPNASSTQQKLDLLHGAVVWQKIVDDPRLLESYELDAEQHKIAVQRLENETAVKYYQRPSRVQVLAWKDMYEDSSWTDFSKKGLETYVRNHLKPEAFQKGALRRLATTYAKGHKPEAQDLSKYLQAEFPELVEVAHANN